MPKKKDSEYEEEEYDDGDQVIEKNGGSNLVMYGHFDHTTVDLMQVERVYRVVKELFASY